ncbi:MAG TPA: hypothetical protein VEQ85_11070, partial [Lacipirellulaceae bacterium]|nr:hypothetical protein [Lacipirellulaceae bacterium]
RPEGDFWTRLHDSVVDGLDEASGDLVPGSPFLTRLNARARNPRVRYAIFLGTRTPVWDGAWTTLRWALARAGRNEQLGALATSVDKVLADMDELVDGKGDGVVAVKRGRLAGVDDVLELPFDHLSATGEPGDDAAVHRVQAELMARLR